MEQKKSPIKERILQYADMLNISRRKFYEKIGVSRGTLESNTGITEDIMAKFIAVFPEINPHWLILGEGEMFRSNIKQNVLNSPHAHTVDKSKTVTNQCKGTKNNSYNNNNGIIISDNPNSNIDNRQYYSDSPDVLRAQIDERDRLIVEKEKILNEKDERIREKDERIREKDERIREKDERIRELLKEKEELKEELKEYKG